MNPEVSGGGVDDASTDLKGMSFVAPDITGATSTAAAVPTLSGPAKLEYAATQVVPRTNFASPAPSVVSISSPASASSSPPSTSSPQVFQSQSTTLVTNGMGHVVNILNTTTPITSAANDAIITDELLSNNILPNSTVHKALAQTHLDSILSTSGPLLNTATESSLAGSLQASVEDGLSLGLDEGARLIMTSDTVSQQQQAQTTPPHAEHSHTHSHSVHSTHSPQSSHSPHALLGTPPLQQVTGLPVVHPSHCVLSQTSSHSLPIMHQMANFPIDPSVVSVPVPVSASGPMPVQVGTISRHGHAHTTSTSSLASALDEPQAASLTIATHVQTQNPSNLTSIGMNVGNIPSDIGMSMLGSSIGTVQDPSIGLSGMPLPSGANGPLVDGPVFPAGSTVPGGNLLSGFDRSRSGSLSVASPGSVGAISNGAGIRGSASFSPTDFPLMGATPPSASPNLHLPHSQTSPREEVNTVGADAHITVLDNMLSGIVKAAQSAREACATGQGLEAGHKIDEMKRTIALVSDLLQATFLDGNHNDGSGSSASPPAGDFGNSQMNQGGASSMILNPVNSFSRHQQLTAHLQRAAPGIIPNFAQISSVHHQLKGAVHSAPIGMHHTGSNSLGPELSSLIQLPLSADAALLPNQVTELDVDQDMEVMDPIPQVASAGSNLLAYDYEDHELDPDGSRKRCASTTGDRVVKALKREPTEEPPQILPIPVVPAVSPLTTAGPAMSVNLGLQIPLQPQISPPHIPLPSPGTGALNTGSLSLPMGALPPPSNVPMNGSSLPSSRPGSSSGMPPSWPPLTHPSLPHSHTYPRTVTPSVTRSGSVSSLPSLSVTSPSTIMGPPSHPASATPLSPVGPPPGFEYPVSIGVNESVQSNIQGPLVNLVQSYSMDSTQGAPHGILYPPQGFPQTNPNAATSHVGRTSRSSSFSNPFAFGMGMDNPMTIPPPIGSNSGGQRPSPPMTRNEPQVRMTRSRASTETGASLRGSFNSTSRSSSRGGHDSEGDNGITTSITRSHRQQRSLGQIGGSSSASARSRASSRDATSQDLNSSANETVVLSQPQQNGSVAAHPNIKEEIKSSSSDSGSPGPPGPGGPANEIPAEYRADIDRIFIDFLQNLCSNLQAKDPKGDNIHQTLMAKKMQRLDESPDFRPFKFRIQAFTNTFLSELAKKGYPEEKLPMKKIRHYLWYQPYIIRYTEIGKKAKSKGNHIWVVEARKLAEGGWEFRPQSRKICGAPPGVAYVGVRWMWTPHIWDPQAPKVTTPIQYSSPSLPAWLSWEGGTLAGTPPADATDCDITVDARFTLAGRQHKLTETVHITIAPMTSVNDISFASSRRPSLTADNRRVNSDPVVSQANGVNSRSASQRSSASKMLQVLTSAAERVAQEAQAHVISSRSPSDPPGQQLQSLAKQQHVLTVTAQALDHAAARIDLSPNTLVVAAQQVIMNAAKHVQEDKEITAVMSIRAGEIPPVPSQVTVDEVSLATQSAVAHAVELTGPLSSEVDVMITASSILQQGPRIVPPSGIPEGPSMTPPLDFPRSHSAGAIQNPSFPLMPPSESTSQPLPMFPPSASVPLNLTRSDFPPS